MIAQIVQNINSWPPGGWGRALPYALWRAILRQAHRHEYSRWYSQWRAEADGVYAVDLPGRQIVVRDSEGARDRVTVLPDRVGPSLQQHLQVVKRLHDQDLAEGLSCPLC